MRRILDFSFSFFIFLILFSVSLVSASLVDVGGNGEAFEGVEITPPSQPINYSIKNVNRSDFWDNLDVPTDIPNSEFWVNDTSITFNLYNGSWDNQYKADYQFTTNNFNGSGNITTLGNFMSGDAGTADIPLKIKTKADKAMRLVESSGTEYYDVEVASNGDLIWRNDVGRITARLCDYDGGIGAMFGVGPSTGQLSSNLEILGQADAVNFRIKTAAASWFMLVMGSDDGMRWANNPVAGQSNSNTIFTNFVNKQKDHDHSDLSADPTVFIHSDTDVDDDNTQWISLTHNKSDGVIDTGKGSVFFKGDIGVEGIINNDAIYCESSELVDQVFAVAGTPYRINISNVDEGNGITMETGSINGTNISVDTSGVYHMVAQPQVKAGAGAAGDFHMWLEKWSSGSWADVPDSNIELKLASLEEDVIVLATTLKLNQGEKLRLVVSVSDNGILLHAQSPAGEPVIPSIIFTMYRVGS